MTHASRGRGAAPGTSDKLSEKVKASLESSDTRQTRWLHVMLKPGMGPTQIGETVDRLEKLAPDPGCVRIWERTGIVDCAMSVSSIPEIAKLEEVVWIDFDSEASIEELLD